LLTAKRKKKAAEEELLASWSDIAGMQLGVTNLTGKEKRKQGEFSTGIREREGHRGR